MAVTRQLGNGQRLIDWTDEIVNLPQTFGFIGASGLFEMNPTSQDAIQFELTDQSVTLINSTSRREGNTRKGKPDTGKVISLALPHFKESDYLTYEDIQGYVQAGSDMTAENAANVRVKKVNKQRLRYDQTTEFMKLSCVKGQTITPEGKVVADMFTELGISQTVLTWYLDDPDFSVTKACRDLKSTLAKANRRGSVIQGYEVLVGGVFLDKLMSHPEVLATYNASQNQNNNAPYLNGVGTFDMFGVTNVFNFGGIRFMTYDATFNIEDDSGTVTNVQAIEDEVGHTILRSQGLYTGVYGNSKKLSQANMMGQPVYMYEWESTRDEDIEFEMQFRHLYYCNQPETQIKLVVG